MTTLRSIIAMLLADLTEAQNAANKLSAEISETYRTGPPSTLKFFPVPNALIDEAEFTLRFAIDAVEAQSAPAQRRRTALPPPRLIAADVAAGVAMRLLAGLRGLLAPEALPGPQPDAPALRRQLQAPSVHRALTRNLTAQINPCFQLYAAAPSDAMRAGDVRTALEEGLGSTFEEDPDLAAALGPARDWARSLVTERIVDDVVEALTAAVTDPAPVTDRPVSAQVDVGTDMGNIPKDVLQTVRLHVKLRNYKWIIAEEGHPDIDHLVAES